MIAFFEMAGYAAAVYVPGNIAEDQEGSLRESIVGERINFVLVGSQPQLTRSLPQILGTYFYRARAFLDADQPVRSDGGTCSPYFQPNQSRQRPALRRDSE
jgi:hypothetical protein